MKTLDPHRFMSFSRPEFGNNCDLYVMYLIIYRWSFKLKHQFLDVVIILGNRPICLNSE